MDSKAANSPAGQEAIDRLLRAQQQADVAVAVCREKADALLATARTQSRDIARKADNRIIVIHKQRAKKIKKRVQALIALHRGASCDGVVDRQRLEAAVALLAARLTGGEDAGLPEAGP